MKRKYILIFFKLHEKKIQSNDSKDDPKSQKNRVQTKD